MRTRVAYRAARVCRFEDVPAADHLVMVCEKAQDKILLGLVYSVKLRSFQLPVTGAKGRGDDKGGGTVQPGREVLYFSDKGFQQSGNGKIRVNDHSSLPTELLDQKTAPGEADNYVGTLCINE